MAKDPKLDSDKCVYLEANANDSGIHNPSGVWYMSPDLDLIDSGGKQTNTAKAGEAHKVRVKVRNKGAGCSFGNGFNSANHKIRVDGYVVVASLTININDAKQAKLIGTKDVDPTDVDNTGYKRETDRFVRFGWTPGTDPTTPNGPGSHCLVARAYPTNLDPSNQLFLSDDPHIVQHNITIVQVPSSKPPPPMRIATANVNPNMPTWTQIKTSLILDPPAKLLAYTKQLLQAEPVFKEIALLPYQEIKQLQANNNLVTLKEKLRTLVPTGFRLDMPEIPQVRIQDFSHPQALLDTRGRLYPKRFLADFNLEPDQLTYFEFTPEPFQSQPGTSHLFKLVQYDNGEPTGGMLVVYIVTE